MSSQGLEKLYGREHIVRQVQRLGEEISRDYEGRDILLVGVLKGVFLFFADLVRAISLPVNVDFVRLASYGPHSQTTGLVEFRKDLEMSVTDRHVLIVDDILDSGYTMEALCQKLASRQPASLKTCVLLDKRHARQTPFEADYVGIRFNSGFVVGYGLDYQENFRNLADIYLLDPAQLV
jgi:hypoxanthine phosphoribosyltransferase